MKSFDAKKLLSVLFICLIVFFMGTVGVKLVMSKVLHIYPEETNAAESQPNETYKPLYDWSEKYPFTGDYGFEFEIPVAVETQKEQPSAKENFENAVRTIEGNIDYYTSNLLFGRMKFIELNASFNKLVGMKIVSGTDSVLVMKNGYLTFEAYPIDTSCAQESTSYFANWLKDKGINFLYVQCPSKENPTDNQLPHGIVDNNNLNADKLVDGLSRKNIPYIDLREKLNNDSDDYYSHFFKTDHHWTPETGVWAAGKIAEELNKKYDYGINTDLGNISNYNVDVYEKYCFGSQGKKVTLKYADPENISFIYPKTETNFTVTYAKNEPITGKFEDTLLFRRVFDRIDYYNVSTYSAYLGGNHSLISIRNNQNNNGKRILYISDSFSASVIPYLATEVEDMLVIDLRAFNGSLTTAVDSFKPDTVIVAYNPSSFTSATNHSSAFNFE
ncbi:MAG: hypothetical protein J6A67_00680 [Clostridia bacterium]|nr:hypothetical protein [Clostridia bacterium]